MYAKVTEKSIFSKRQKCIITTQINAHFINLLLTLKLILFAYTCKLIMRSIFNFGLTFAIFAIIEALVLFSIYSLIKRWTKKQQTIVYIVYGLVSLIMLVCLWNFRKINIQEWPPTPKSLFIGFFIGFFAAKLIIAIFTLLHITWRYTRRLLNTIRRSKKTTTDVKLYDISRASFLTYTGVGIGSLVFGSLINGIRNKYNYVVKTVEVPIKNLPKEFHDLKIVQISDIHTGSFDNYEEVKKGFDLIMEQQADIIVFTGDLVNNIAVELDPYKDILSSLSAPLGVYSVLGNHDYGDYFKWDTEAEKEKNLEDLKQAHASFGWQLLNNEFKTIDWKGHPFNIIGVENWSAKPNFPKHGKLSEATSKINPETPLNILLSHDPSHWDAEIRNSQPFIHLTLSGHTHGMQYGVKLPFMKWSPVQYVYEQWAGLYSKNHQHIYVNTGFGFLGYPGRVGIMPEITVLKFTTA